MRKSTWLSRSAKPATVRQASPGSRRDQIARWLAISTVVCLGVAFAVSASPQFLMPGALTSAHGSIETCSSCHAKSGNGTLSWVAGLAPGDPHADSKACLNCHMMPDTAFNAHGASTAILQQSTERLLKVAASQFPPLSATLQSTAFPTHAMVADGLQCATCHQEHQGTGFDLKALSNEQCRSCHAVQFDRFDGAHPKFDQYPFKRRTRIAYDHAEHFAKHYPELAKKQQDKSIPATCSACHDGSGDRRIMAVAPFEKACSTCHLDQITGKERVSGPKGVAFLSLPGLDIPTLRKRGAQIGEWPEDSEAALTPFMKVMIAQTAAGRDLIARLNSVTLQDLTKAGDDQIKAVTDLVWEIKRLLHEMISSNGSTLLANLSVDNGPQLSAGAIADLTASLPRDVIVSAQRQWLPKLAQEIAARPDTTGAQRSGLNPPSSNQTSIVRAFMRTQANVKTLSPLEWVQAEQDAAGDSEETMKRRPLPSGTPRSIEERDKGPATPPLERAIKAPGAPVGSGEQAPIATGSEAAPTSQPQGPEGSKAEPPAETNASDQGDDLLAPTDAEREEIAARQKGLPPQKSAGSATPAANAQSGTKPTPSIGGSGAKVSAEETNFTAQETAGPIPQTADGLDNDIDPESWADTGGWYRQDYAIFYRPVGHKDKFVASWLRLTGPVAPRGDTRPEAAVFDALTSKDAQGSCTKCHSVDDGPGGGRIVNFTPLTAATKSGKFTRFIHEPHFGVMDDRGCLGCHSLAKDRTMRKTYEQGDPKIFNSNFNPVRKDACQTCHATGLARQDCVLCHDYHVNGVTTPVTQTKIPAQ